MFKHKKSILTLLLAAAVFLAGSALTEVLAEEMPVLLSLEELAEFNGKDGKPAYIAVDGVIYDVTESSAWEGGGHKGLEAGLDLTAQFKDSPHDVSTLDKVNKIGILIP